MTDVRPASTTNNKSFTTFLDIDDNPWESAAQQNASLVQSSFQMGGDTSHGGNEEAYEEEERTCLSRFARLIIKLLTFLELVVGMILLCYGILLTRDHIGDEDVALVKLHKALVVLSLSTASVLLLRCFVGTFALFFCHKSSENELVLLFRPCGIFYATVSSPVLAVYFFVLAIMSLAAKRGLLELLSQYQEQVHLPFALVDFVASHYYVVWSVLLGWSVLECIRYQLLLFYERPMYDEDGLEGSTFQSPSSRPAWWRRGRNFATDELQESLLRDHTGANGLPDWVSSSRRQRYLQQTGVTPDRGPSRGAIPSPGVFSWFRRRDDDRNARDDGSVTFASVQEEWASRAEEDPYWWSREEEMEAGKGGDDRKPESVIVRRQGGSDETPEKDVSWLKDHDDVA